MKAIKFLILLPVFPIVLLSFHWRESMILSSGVVATKRSFRSAVRVTWYELLWITFDRPGAYAQFNRAEKTP